MLAVGRGGRVGGIPYPIYWHTNTLAKLIKGINHDYWVGGQAAKGMVPVIQQRLALMHIGRTYDDEDSTGMGSIHRRRRVSCICNDVVFSRRPSRRDCMEGYEG